MTDGDLHSLLETLAPAGRDILRRLLIHDQANRDAVASDLLRHRDGRGEDWADMIDMLCCIRRYGERSRACWRRLTPRQVDIS
jgi:hypothetical protein